MALHWFRKGLRIHDNPALLDSCSRGLTVYPVFILDPHFTSQTVGPNRYLFLLQSLDCLDSNLRNIGSRLYIAKGKPEDCLPILFRQWNIEWLSFEKDSEPYAIRRDNIISNTAKEMGINVVVHSSHTIRELESYSHARKDITKAYASFVSHFMSMGAPPIPVEAPSWIGEKGQSLPDISTLEAMGLIYTHTPTLQEMGYCSSGQDREDSNGGTLPRLLFPGGENEGLSRLHNTIVSRPEWVNAFEKPKSAPNVTTAEPSTTALSPYLKFGCVSARLVYAELMKIKAVSKKHTDPPVSLQGQLLWREFFYFCSTRIPRFDHMDGNPQCRQIPWERNSELVLAWEQGRTGYPFIDAIMNQLRAEGWIHHLARHAVACFLTRGDLWQHWEEGARIFDYYLLDSDWALNNANWQWLSCSNFFHQYFRVYSPVAFGKKTDMDGNYIRKWVPQLAHCPNKYIYEPWKAPIKVQQECRFIIGSDYPKRIVIHEIAMKQNMDKMKIAFSGEKIGGNMDTTHVGHGGSAKEGITEETREKNVPSRKSSFETTKGESRRKRDITTFFRQHEPDGDEVDEDVRKILPRNK